MSDNVSFSRNSLKVRSIADSKGFSYVEINRLLYSSNTFIFLQNRGLCDLKSIILPERFKLLRSIHVHWQFRELGTFGAWAWTEDVFGADLALLHESHMPQLRCISIFVQGPLHLKQTYKSILSTVTTCIASIDRTLDLFVLRVPNPLPTPPYWTFSTSNLGNMIIAHSPAFSVVRPSVTAEEVADVDVGVDVGWRCGTLFLSTSEGVPYPGNMMRRYVVWTPLPRGLTWPCRF
jgi:hypothetical protein